jgi:hypothetical protein
MRRAQGTTDGKYREYLSEKQSVRAKAARLAEV